MIWNWSMETKGRGWARFGFGLGISASVLGNIAHSYIHPHPRLGDVTSSAFWPVALLIALEVISRVQWPEGRWWWITRFGGLTTVALIAALTSYLHMAALLGYYQEDRITVSLGPLSVDGLMVVCSVALLAIADNIRRTPVSELLCELVGAMVGQLVGPNSARGCFGC
jgi:hypothetical protein